MGDVVRSVLVVVSGAAAAAFGLKALRHWWAERAGRAYELDVNRTGTALRGGAAGLAAVLAGVLALPLLDLHPGVTAPSASPAGSSAAAPAPDAVPSPPPRTPAPAPPPPEVRTLEHPAGGTLDQFRDGTRVWLPPQYASRHATHLAFPVLVVHLPSAAAKGPRPPYADIADLFDGFTLAVRRGLADPFVLVLPPDCGHDVPALAEVARRYRVLPARTATGLMGIGADAPCALHEALATPARYGAAAGIAGHYPPPARQPSVPPPPATAPAGRNPTRTRTPSPNPSPSTPHTTAPTTAPPATRTPASSTASSTAPPTTPAATPLLLASLPGDTAAQTAALRLRDALHPHGDAVRLIDGIPSSRELFAQVAAYLTEKLDSPSAAPAPSAPTTSTPPAAYPPPVPTQPRKTAQTP